MPRFDKASATLGNFSCNPSRNFVATQAAGMSLLYASTGNLLFFCSVTRHVVQSRILLLAIATVAAIKMLHRISVDGYVTLDNLSCYLHVARKIALSKIGLSIKRKKPIVILSRG